MAKYTTHSMWNGEFSGRHNHLNLVRLLYHLEVTPGQHGSYAYDDLTS